MELVLAPTDISSPHNLSDFVNNVHNTVPHAHPPLFVPHAKPTSLSSTVNVPALVDATLTQMVSVFHVSVDASNVKMLTLVKFVKLHSFFKAAVVLVDVDQDTISQDLSATSVLKDVPLAVKLTSAPSANQADYHTMDSAM